MVGLIQQWVTRWLFCLFVLTGAVLRLLVNLSVKKYTLYLTFVLPEQLPPTTSFLILCFSVSLIVLTENILSTVGLNFHSDQSWLKTMCFPGRETCAWAYSLPHSDFGLMIMALEGQSVILWILSCLWVRGGERKSDTYLHKVPCKNPVTVASVPLQFRCDGNFYITIFLYNYTSI